MIQWLYFPKSDDAPAIVKRVVAVFANVLPHVDSAKHDLKSNEVLAQAAPGLKDIGFNVETGKKQGEKLFVPVLFGRNGRPEKSFDADAWNPQERIVVEVEAGRGVLNNQFLKDLFQACMMHDVDYCCIAVRQIYKGSLDFEQVVAFFETLYTSDRLHLPLKGVLVIGY